jgi:ferritin-like metal-binding protein YciE
MFFVLFILQRAGLSRLAPISTFKIIFYIGMKTCSRCKIEKVEEAFHNTTKGKNGKANNCKMCVKKYNAEFRAKKKAKINTMLITAEICNLISKKEVLSKDLDAFTKAYKSESFFDTFLWKSSSQLGMEETAELIRDINKKLKALGYYPS